MARPTTNRSPSPRGLLGTATVVAVTLLGGLLGGCSVLAPLPESATLETRLSDFPTAGLDLEGPVAIHWDTHQIPFIEAASDGDLAYALGLAHAHLRLGQMETLRRVSQGRTAEIAGPLAVEIDHALRILDLGKAVPATLAAMPADSRRWLDRFVAGINAYAGHAAARGRLPHEFRIYGIEPEPWTATDVLTLGRLASVDVSWIAWFGLLRERDQPGFAELWARLQTVGVDSLPSFAWAGGSTGILAEILTGTGKAGSNSIAVSATRSATGGALMANDPHLGVNLPNLWLIAGMKSPGIHAVGLMIPGVPFVALGRNQRIAWGGNNMRAWSSDLFDVSGLPPDAIVERTERLRVRWWPSVDVTVRDTPAGPIVSDAPPVPVAGTVALTWMGHRPSDELTAMLKVNRAGDFEGFRAAFEGWSVSGQNFLYADVEGNIGQVMAVRLPVRDPGPIPDPVRPLADRAAWDTTVGTLDLPHVLNPASGHLASANNKPADTSLPVSFYFAGDDRIERMNDALSAAEAVTPELLLELQRDTYMASAHRLARLFATRLAISHPGDPVGAGIAAWDGRYEADSRDALAFELTVAGFANAFMEPGERRPLEGAGRLFDLLADAVEAADPERVDAALVVGIEGAREPFGRYGSWGDMHRMVLRHPLAMVPVLGGRYAFADFPVGGSSATLMKTAHDLTTKRHATRFGSQARHLSDLADPDANWFLLLGGQDGWFNSASFLDHVPLWRDGRMIRVPLTPEAFATGAVRRMELRR